MEFATSLVEFAIDDSHLVLVELSNLFIEKESQAVVVRLGEGDAVEGFDLLVEERSVAGVNGAHPIRRIQHRNDDHNGQRQQSDEHFGTDFEVCQKTQLCNPPW